MIRSVLITVLALAAVPAAAENYFGAVAYSFSGDKFGRSWNFETEQGAIDRAMQECREQGGSGCEIGVRVSNTCGAFAVPVTGGAMASSGSSWGFNTHDDAKARALAECKKRSSGRDCRVVGSTCNFGN
jgi:hypothetical protein